MKQILILHFSVLFMFIGCNTLQANMDRERANATLDSVYKHYGVKGEYLLHETYPFNEKHTATYLAGQAKAASNPYSYLWPYSGSLSAVVALYEVDKKAAYLNFFDSKVLPGLELYFDKRHSPDGYASYISSAPLSDRFYDDNVWIGIDFTDLYLATKDKKYLEKAEMIWKFIESGTDSILGGGIYWCEQQKYSKNTCSNASGAVLALKLYKATKNNSYLEYGKTLYEWTKKNLQDPNDFLYYDNIKLDGGVDKRKFSYNSGQMLQASVLLHELTNDKIYLTEAQNIAKSSYDYFFNGFQTEGKDSFKLLKKGNVWFTSVMLRGFVELYLVDKNKEYLDAFQSNLDYAWKYMRDENGLFNSDWSGQTKDESKWLLTQFAMVEMYARLGKI